MSRKRNLWEAGALLLIVLLAGILRFYRLAELPPGLHFDEGFKGVTARELLEGAPARLFFESDMGEEPIAIYLVAGSLGLLGREPWVIRLASAIVGLLTIPLAWWLGRELYRLRTGYGAGRGKPTIDPERGTFREKVVGLSTALVLAILYWHLSFSRIGMEPILVPFFATLAFAALARGLNTGRVGKPAYPWFVLAGLALGGSLYTYKAGYFVPVLAVLFIAYAAVASRGFFRRHGRGLLVTALVCLVVAAPITAYFVTHPANFLQRPTSVTVSGSQGTSASAAQGLAENLPRVLGMFFIRGDANPRSNLPGRPALDPFLAVLFVVGAGRALAGLLRGQAAMALPLIWLGVMVVPTLVTDYAPHFGRAIGATPALALLCALGLDTLLRVADTPFLGARAVQARTLMTVLVASGLVFSGAVTARAYFVTWGSSPDLFYAYDVGLAEIAGSINAVPPDQDVYLTPTAREHYTLQFLVQRPFSSFDGREGLVFPPPGRPATIIVLLGEDDVTLPTLQQVRPDGLILWTLDDSYGHPYAAAYHLPAAASPAPLPDHTAEVTFGDAMRLLGYSLDHEPATPGESISVTLYWQALDPQRLAPVPEPYTVFTHMLGQYNPETSGPLWAGHDGQPDGGHYPTSAWQPGQVILDRHTLSIPADTPSGDYQLEAGLYLLSTMGRLPAVDAAGQRLPDDAAPLGSIRVQGPGGQP